MQNFPAPEPLGLVKAGDQIFDAIMQKEVYTVFITEQMLPEVPRYLVPIGDGVEHHHLYYIFAKK